MNKRQDAECGNTLRLYAGEYASHTAVICAKTIISVFVILDKTEIHNGSFVLYITAV